MKIIHQDRRKGIIKLRIDNLDDLWHLKNVIVSGDVISSFTYRREETQSDKLRSDRGEKKPMWLDIEVEKVEFHDFTDRLRVLGVIVEGPQDLGSYHTLNLTSGDELTIKKSEWKEHELRRLKEAVDAGEKPKITFVALEQNDAVVAILHQYGIKEMAHLSPNMGGKMYQGEVMTTEEFFQEIVAVLKNTMAPGSPLVILGPGFVKEDFHGHVKRHHPDLVKSVEVIPTGVGGMTGIHEVLKTGRERSALEGHRVSYESQQVEELLSEIKKDGEYAYGDESVSRAVEMGAVEKLLVLDSHVRNEDNEELMRKVEQLGGEVLVIGGSHQGGEKLKALGGLGAFLRYKIE